MDLKIRNLPEELEKELREMKRVHRMSLAAAAIRLMRRGRNGVAEGPERGHGDPTETPQRGHKDPSKTNGKKFEPPSVEEAGGWYREKGYHFGLEEWFAYYEVRGWVPKGAKGMAKSWKGLMVTWEGKWRETHVPAEGAKAPPMKRAIDVLREQEAEARARGEIE